MFLCIVRFSFASNGITHAQYSTKLSYRTYAALWYLCSTERQYSSKKNLKRQGTNWIPQEIHMLIEAKNEYVSGRDGVHRPKGLNDPEEFKVDTCF